MRLPSSGLFFLLADLLALLLSYIVVDVGLWRWQQFVNGTSVADPLRFIYPGQATTYMVSSCLLLIWFAFAKDVYVRKRVFWRSWGLAWKGIFGAAVLHLAIIAFLKWEHSRLVWVLLWFTTAVFILVVRLLLREHYGLSVNTDIDQKVFQEWLSHSRRNNLATHSALLLKRTIDWCLAVLLLIGLSPLLLIISFFIYLDGRPIFFSQLRVGKNGAVFNCLKFRTMRVNAESELAELLLGDEEKRYLWETYRKLPKDPRVTFIGRWLRKTSLDELPQLWNVIRGEMSLVGPRPIMLDEIPIWSKRLLFYQEVWPGITGLWQVSGRNKLSYARRMTLDVWYIKNWTVWIDIYILLKTIKVVLKGDGAN